MAVTFEFKIMYFALLQKKPKKMSQMYLRSQEVSIKCYSQALQAAELYGYSYIVAMCRSRVKPLHDIACRKTRKYYISGKKASIGYGFNSKI